MGYDKLLNYLERKTADTHELQAASAIIGLRQRVAELESIHSQTVEKGVAGFEALCQRVAELERGLDSAYQLADHYRDERDALMKQRDELVAAIKKFLDENNPEGFGCACEPDRLCGPCSEAKRQRPLYAAIARVKEK